MRYCIFIISLFILSSCTETPESPQLAKAFQSVLTLNDIKTKIPSNLANQDSIIWVKNFVRNWLREQILLHEADKVLSESEKNKSAQLEVYRKELILYELQRKLLASYADTAITNREILEYYHANRKEFELKKNIARIHFVKIRKNTPGFDQASEWFFSGDSISMKRLENYCRLYAENYFFNERVWLSFDDILKEIPLRAYNEEAFLRNNKNTTLQDASFTYLIKIIDFRIRNDVSPIEFEVDNIRNILTHKKRTDFIKNAELSIVRKAESGGAAKILIK